MRFLSLTPLPALALVAALAFAGALNANQNDSSGEWMVKGVSTFFSASGAAVEQAGGINFNVNVSSGGFVTSVKGRELARTYSQGMREANRVARAASKTLPFRVAPGALLAAEALPDVVARAAGGDYQGAVAGAGALAVGNGFVAGGATVMGIVGAATGAAVGSYVPVVGTAVGETIGGAVGRIAGGFIAATAYDLLIKDGVAQEIERVIAPFFDPRSERVRAYEDKLRAQAAADMKPIWEAYHRVSQDFDLRSVELYAAPTLILRGSAVSRDTDSGGEPEPGAPEELVAITGFDARPIGATTVMRDGTVYSSGREIFSDVTGQTPECIFLSVRDGHFFQKCEEADNHSFEATKVHIDSTSYYLGVVRGNLLDGTFMTWQRNYYFDSTDRDDVEYMRDFDSGRISGTIDADGRITMTLWYEQDRTIDAEADWVNDHLHFSGAYSIRARDQSELIDHAEVVSEIVGTAEQGTLMFPNLTAEDIRDTEFELPTVFFQHGVEPPERIR